MNVYEIKMDAVPHFNKNDFCEYLTLTAQEIVDLITSGEKAKSDLIKLIQIFYMDRQRQICSKN